MMIKAIALLMVLSTPAVSGEFASNALEYYDNSIQPAIDIANQSKEDPDPELPDFGKCMFVLSEGNLGHGESKQISELDCAFTYTPEIMPDPSFKLEAHLNVAGVPLLGTLEANCYGTIDKNKLRAYLFSPGAFPKSPSKIREMYQFKVDGCLNVLALVPYCIDIAKDGPRSGQAYAANANLMAISILYGTGYTSEDPKSPPRMKCQSGWASMVKGANASTTTMRTLPADRTAMVSEYYTMYTAAKAAAAKTAAKKKNKGGY